MPVKAVIEAPSEAALSASQRPETFRLPKRGGDPFFGSDAASITKAKSGVTGGLFAFESAASSAALRWCR